MFEQSSNEIGKQITIGNREPLSETQSLFSKTKWQWRSPSVDKNGLDNNFNSSARAWSNNHMYRTHYQDMSEKVPVPLRNYAIPKYAGFIPGKEGNSELGRSYTKITRRCINKEDEFQKTADRFRSTDFKSDQRAFDKTRPNFFRGYGKTTMLAPHPCLNEEWSTSFRKTYLKPNNRTKPNAHTQLPVQEIEHDNALTKSQRASTIASGFQANSQLFDETSWRTEANTHTDIIRTEYRNRYNQAKPFHKEALVNSHGRINKKEDVYDVADQNSIFNSKARDRASIKQRTGDKVYQPRQGLDHVNKNGPAGYNF